LAVLITSLAGLMGLSVTGTFFSQPGNNAHDLFWSSEGDSFGVGIGELEVETGVLPESDFSRGL
jgi:hypothetical protein